MPFARWPQVARPALVPLAAVGCAGNRDVVFAVLGDDATATVAFPLGPVAEDTPAPGSQTSGQTSVTALSGTLHFRLVGNDYPKLDVGDFDGDGCPDVLVGGAGLTLLTGRHCKARH